MSVKISCDQCGHDITAGSRITVTSEGFHVGNGVEHFCGAACVYMRIEKAAGRPSLELQYRLREAQARR